MKGKRITTYIVVIVCLSLMIFAFFYNSDVFASKTGKTNVNKLNVRTGPGTTYSVVTNNGKKVQLNKGTNVTILNEKSGWYYVSFTYNKKTLKGYVKKTYVGSIKTSSSSTPTTTKATTKKGTVNATSLKVRTGPGTAYAQVTSNGTNVILKKGTAVTIHSEKSGWYYISFTFNKKTLKGYVSKPYVTVAASNTKASSSATSSTTSIKVVAVTRDSLKVRKAAGSSAAQLTYNKLKVVLKKGQNIVIRKETIKNNVKWYYVSFTYSGKTMYGWVSGDYVKLTLKSTVAAHIRPATLNILKNTSTNLKVNGKVVTLKKGTNVVIHKEEYKKGIRYYYVSFKYSSKTQYGYVKAINVDFGKTASSSSTTTSTPAPTKTPEATKTPSLPTATVKSLKEFTAAMKKAGFPEDYIPALYELHKKYPSWVFTAYDTGLEFESAVDAQYSVKGRATLQKTAYQWISKLTHSYDYINDGPILMDKGGFYAASDTAIKYFMDPRNFLDETHIFMFENLGYDKENNTKAVVQNMVAGTPLEGSFTYTNAAGKKITMTYVDAILDAANYSSTSPVHLTARMKQEIITSKGFSASATGTTAGYEGLYNFFNIGATDSTVSPIINGLKYAKNGSSDATLNAKMFIPWDNPYKAIMGGAKFLGDNYIARGQNTIYFQKFNVSMKNYGHQYMTNIQAPYAEAAKSYSGYKNMGMLNMPIVFTIPVYNKMPSQVSVHPDNVSALMKKNFNNYLKACKITDGTTTYLPTSSKKFTYSTVNYTLTINAPTITITPTLAGKDASLVSIVVKKDAKDKGTAQTVKSGAAKVNLVKGSQLIVVTVKAANGNTRAYTFTINRTK